MTVETNFDETAGVANYHIVVEEGKPYQMGEVLIKNASGDEEKRIRGKWQMAQRGLQCGVCQGLHQKDV